MKCYKEKTNTSLAYVRVAKTTIVRKNSTESTESALSIRERR